LHRMGHMRNSKDPTSTDRSVKEANDAASPSTAFSMRASVLDRRNRCYTIASATRTSGCVYSLANNR